jgi:predicted metal-dependent hydrolase
MPGMSIPYQVRRTGRRSRNISVRVYPDATVRVSAPTWASLKDIQGVVQMHAVWISEQLDQARAVAPRYDEGSLHFFLGKRYPLDIQHAPGRRSVVFTGSELRVTAPAHTPEQTRALLRHWYRTQAAESFPQRLAGICPGLPWLKDEPSWGLRRMRAQWGNCSSAGHVTFNTQLMKAPLDLIDYVILHELTHIKHHDHGRGFERTMDGHMPDWRSRRRRLNALGAMILVD